MENNVDKVVKRAKEYLISDGTTIQLDFKHFFLKLIQDHLKAFHHPLAIFFPFLSHYKLVNPFRSNAKNVRTFQVFMHEIIEESKDTDSILYEILNSKQFTYEDIFSDMIGFMIAASETSSHSLTTALYYLK